MVLPIWKMKSRHLQTVLRHKAIHFRLQTGWAIFMRLWSLGRKKKHAVAQIISTTVVEPERPYRLHVAIAPTKNMGDYSGFGKSYRNRLMRSHPCFAIIPKENTVNGQDGENTGVGHEAITEGLSSQNWILTRNFSDFIIGAVKISL